MPSRRHERLIIYAVFDAHTVFYVTRLRRFAAVASFFF
jgi:hypothetical protein